MTTPILTASQLAKMANLHPNHICRLCKQGDIPSARHGTNYVIERTAGMRWLIGRAVKRSKR